MTFEDLQDAGINVRNGMDFTGGELPYLATLQRFYLGFQKNMSEIGRCLLERDIEGYAIAVHALKSNVRLLGAETLGNQAEKLEMSARAGNWDEVYEMNPDFLMAYRSFQELLEPYGKMERVRLEGEIDEEEAKEIAQKLLTAIENCEDDEALDLVRRLDGYPFRITQKNLLKQAQRALEDFEYDEAAELVKQVAAAIG